MNFHALLFLFFFLVPFFSGAGEDAADVSVLLSFCFLPFFTTIDGSGSGTPTSIGFD